MPASVGAEAMVLDWRYGSGWICVIVLRLEILDVDENTDEMIDALLYADVAANILRTRTNTSFLS